MTNKSTRGKNDITSFYYINICVCVCVRACGVIHENTTIKDGSFNDEGDDFQNKKPKLYLTRDIELIIKYRVIWIPSVLTVFSLRTFTCDVK